MGVLGAGTGVGVGARAKSEWGHVLSVMMKETNALGSTLDVHNYEQKLLENLSRDYDGP